MNPEEQLAELEKHLRQRIEVLGGDLKLVTEISYYMSIFVLEQSNPPYRILTKEIAYKLVEAFLKIKDRQEDEPRYTNEYNQAKTSSLSFNT